MADSSRLNRFTPMKGDAVVARWGKNVESRLRSTGGKVHLGDGVRVHRANRRFIVTDPSDRIISSGLSAAECIRPAVNQTHPALWGRWLKESRSPGPVWTTMNENCVTAMRSMRDASIDAIICDPPYGLDFMGKEWDNPVMLGQVEFDENAPRGPGGLLVGPGNRSKGYAANDCYMFQRWATEWATEAFRVAKPGAHIVAFGGTRTYHRLACAIEDAGWEIRDCLVWAYGCLSEDTEILVDGEFVHYSKAMQGSLALCYDVNHGTYEWQPIKQTFVYDYDDTAYRIESGSTDQIVTRNHKCIVESDGRWTFSVAEEAAWKQEARVPVLEDLPGLLESIRMRQQNSSGQEHSVQGVCRCSEKGESSKEGGSEGGEFLVLRVRENNIQTKCMGEVEESDLLKTVQRRSQGDGLGETRPQGKGRVDGCEYGFLPGENVRGEESGMERRRDFQEDTRELCGTEVCQMSQRVCGNVQEGWVRDGASTCRCNGNRSVSLQIGGRPPHRPQHEEQPQIQPDAFQHKQGAQAVRIEWETGSSLARITPFAYKGKVWCVQVDTGSFVARRNGKVFVTGNSGFPKNHDVGKAIDRIRGAEREVVGVGKAALAVGTFNQANYGSGGYGFKAEYMETAPSHDDAKRWDGWGTALKPAWESIVLARKPFQSSVAENVLEYGTGAINIGGCRIGDDEIVTRSGDGKFSKLHYENGNGWDGDDQERIHSGRWPSNFIHDGSEEVDRVFPQVLHFGRIDSAGRYFAQCPVDESDAELLRIIYMPKAQKADREEGLDEQADGTMNRVNPGGLENDPRWRPLSRKNVHPTVKPTALMRYLCRLVTPPGGVVLDPFMGSGSTGKAAVLEGFRFIGCELSPEYFSIANKRIEHAEQEFEKQSRTG